MSAVEVYTKEVHAQTHRYAAWLPTEKVKVGAVGYLEGKAFLPLRHLKNFGISAKVVNDPSAGADYRFMSQGVSEVGGNVAASGIPTSVGAGAAKIKIGFARAHSVYFALHGCVGSAIDDLVALGEQILPLVKAGKWPLDYVVVTRIITAASATILQAEAKDAEIELEGSVSATPVADILKVGGGAKVVSKRSVGIDIATQKKLTPLLALAKVQYTFWDKVFRREPRFSYVPSRRSINLTPFTSYVSTTPTIDLATDVEVKGDLLLNVRVPQLGEYVDITDLLDLTTKTAPARVSRSITAAPTNLGIPTRIPKNRFLDMVDEAPNLALDKISEGFIGLNVTLPKTRSSVSLRPLVDFAEKVSESKTSELLAAKLSFEEII